MLLVTEILSYGERSQADAPARARRLVHLPVDQDAVLQHAGATHLVQQFMPLARALADAGKDRNASVAPDHGVDQFHYHHGLANARATEHRRLAALR